FGTFAANAQVGIGTATPNKSAELLIESSNRGLLIPNVALTSTTDKNTITNGNVQSLMVYATKTQGDITPGYYYWDINKWVRLTADKDIPQIVVNNFQEIVNKDGDKVQNIIKNIVKNTEGNVIYEGDKLYQITKEGDKIVKQEIKDKLTTISYDEATGDYIYYNENAVDRNGKIIGEGIRIKVKETVINKFGDIINNKTVQEHITNYLDGTHVGGNVYYEGDKLTYVTKEGDRKEVSINQVVTANESKTAIITVDKKQYYVSEEYLVANKGVVPTTVDAKNLPKGIYAIDVVGGVVNNFEEIVKTGPINVDGRTFNTINDYIKYVTESKGGFTKIVYNKEGDVVFQEWNETTQKFENVDNSKFGTIVKGNETVTTLVKNANGTFTYYNEKEIGADGQPKAGATGVTIDPKEVSVALNTTTNKYEFKNSNGDVVGEIDSNANSIVYNDNTTNLGATNVQGAIEKLLEKITTVEGTKGDLALAGGLEFTGTTNGTAKLLADAGIQIADGGVSTDKIADKAVTSDKLNGGQGAEGRVGVAGADGTITYQTLDSVVKANETVTVLVENKNGTYTYYNEKQIGADGKPLAGATGVTLDPVLVNVEDLSKTEGKYIFKDSEGAPIVTIDVNSDNILYNNADSGLTSTNVKDALDELANTIATTKGKLSVAGGLEFTGGTDGTAKLLADAGIQIADGGVSTDKIADKAVTSDKLNGGQGAEGRVGVAGADGTITYQTLDSVVKANETVTVLVENKNGTFTYYNEKEIDASGQPKAGATGVTIDPKEVSVALNTTTNKYEFKNSNGDVVGEIDSNANSIVYNDNTTNLGATNVQGAIEKLLEKITTVEGTKGELSVAGGLEFTGGTDGTAKLLADAGIQIANKGIKTEKLDDKTVTNEKLADKSVSADKMTSFTTDNGTKTPVGEGQIPVADGKGGVIYKEISGETLKGKALTSGSIKVFGGDKALLDGTVIEVQGGNKDGQVLITKTKEIVVGKDADGKDVRETHQVTEWVDADKVGVEVTNGIQKITDGTTTKLGLGGKLTQPTVIDTEDNTLAIANLKEVAKDDVKNNSVVMADANGVLKETSAANLIGEAITDGKIVAKSLTSESIYVDGGANALLKDAKLDLKGGTVDGQVLVTVTKDVVVGEDA
ncbi:MAG: hypothetical protein ACRCVU_00850, partial [Flavobacterium sp.]